jgi:hypothetical protein
VRGIRGRCGPVRLSRSRRRTAGNDIRDAIGCELFGEDLKNLLSDGVGNPRVNAVTEDVVELAILLVKVEDALMTELNVCQSKVRNDSVALLDLLA